MPVTAQILGCGLIGTSIGMALVEAGWSVHLSDLNPANEEMAAAKHAGQPGRAANPDVVIVAIPPQTTAQMVEQSLNDWPEAIITDVASVKSGILGELRDHPQVHRYVGSHPMAGSERSGPLAASKVLFQGRPWAVCAHEKSSPDSVAVVNQVAEAVGATIVAMDPETHDRAVAVVSHVPHVMAFLTAARLVDAEQDHLALAGPGLRDVTRIAASDPKLWRQILAANSTEVSNTLKIIRDDLDEVIRALSNDGEVDSLLALANQGTALLPGRHGGSEYDLARVFAQIADKPGELQRLMAATAEAQINIEDIRIDHELGREVGLVEVTVRADAADELVRHLTDNDWTAYR